MALSFKDAQGNDIRFTSIRDLKLDTDVDVISGEITAYVIIADDVEHKVTKEVFEGIKNIM